MKILAEDLWPLILDFIDQNFDEAYLKKIVKTFDLSHIDYVADPIVK